MARPISEVLWLQEWLLKTLRKAPQRRWKWAAQSASWDRAEVLEGFRREATTDSDEIWKAVCAHEVSGRWPKLSGRAAHFLRERLSEGLVLCSERLRTCDPSQTEGKPSQPKDSEALVRRVLIDHWNSKGVNYWMERHLDDFQEPDPEDWA